MLIGVLGLTISSGAAGAETGPYVELLPAVESIATNGRIYITGNKKADGYHALLEDLLDECQCYRPYLVNSRHKVPLARVALPNSGQGARSDDVIVFRPKRRLRTNRVYQLQIFHGRSPSPVEYGETWSWKTGSRPDRQAPRWLGPPAVGQDGKLSLSLARPEAVLEVAVTLKPISDGTRKRTRLFINSAVICPGDSVPCVDYRDPEVCDSSVFDGTKGDVGKRFHVRIETVDGAGNRRRVPGPAPVMIWDETEEIEVCVTVPGSTR